LPARHAELTQSWSADGRRRQASGFKRVLRVQYDLRLMGPMQIAPDFDPGAVMTTGTSSARPLRVFLVDDERLAREMMKVALKSLPGVEIVAECGTASAAIRLIENEAPDLVFLDVQMPGNDGFSVIERIGADRM